MTLTILIVEDNQMSRRLVSETLKWQECEVLEAGDAEGALEALRGRLPDLVLLDMGLPKMDGLTFIRVLRSDPRTARLPVVILSARAMAGEVEAAFAAGCDGYITKPISTRELRHQIACVLQRDLPPLPPPRDPVRAFSGVLLAKRTA